MTSRWFGYGLLLALGGCAAVESIPEDVFYRLPPPTAAPILPHPLTVQPLHVAAFRAHGILRERAIVDTEGSGVSLHQHRYAFWLDSPEKALPQQLVQYLRLAQAAPLVSATPTPAAAYDIDGTIKNFERVTGTPVPSARVSIELELTERDTGRTLLIKDYTESIPAADASFEQWVLAMAAGVHNIYRRFIEDAANVVDSLSPPKS